MLEQKVRELIEDLEKKKELLNDENMQRVPSDLVAPAIYGYIINELKGMVESGEN